MIVFKLILLSGIVLLIGTAALGIFTAGRKPLSACSVLGLAPGLGIGLIGMGTFYLAYCRVPLNPNTIGIFGGGLLLTLVGLNVAFRRQGISLAQYTIHSKRRLQPIEIALISLTAAACLLVFSEVLTQPMLGFDARAIWGMKSKVMLSYGQIYGEDFLNPDRLHAKQRYPLLLPSAVGFAYHLTGGAEERIGRVIHALLYLALIFFFYETSRRTLGRPGALLGTCLLSTLPAFTIFANGGAASGYSDVPLTYFYCVFVLSLVSWFKQRQATDLALATAFGIFTLFTKNEGLALWGIALATCSLYDWTAARASRRSLQGLAFLVVISVAALLPWFLYQKNLPNLEEDFFRLLTPRNIVAGVNRLPYLLESFSKEFFLRPHLWNLLGPGLVLAFLAAPRRGIREPHGVCLWIALVYCLFVLTIYLVIPWRMEELVPVSLTRLLMSLSPLMVFWMLFQARSARLLPENWTELQEPPRSQSGWCREE